MDARRAAPGAGAMVGESKRGKVAAVRSIRRLLGLDEQVRAEVRDAETVRRIADELDALPRERARYVAAFAYVLARLAHADLEISQAELRTMERLVQEAAELPPAHAALVVQIARSQALEFGGTEHYLVTRQFRDLSTREQRLALLECLFGVASADDHITSAESDEITRIASELGLTRQDVLAMRAAYRQHLAVLKELPS